MKRLTGVAAAIILSVTFLTVTTDAFAQGQCFPHKHGMFDLLTEDQRSEVRGLAIEMWEDGAELDEIHDAMALKLNEWGIDVPDHTGKGHGPCRIMQQLSEEQRTEIFEVFLAMWEDGFDHGQIHQAVAEKLGEYGIDLPRHPGMGHGIRYVMRQLNEEQRAEVRQMMRDMWSDGAPHGEIHDAVVEKLDEFGIGQP
jgi:hypothetical protein